MGADFSRRASDCSAMGSVLSTIGSDASWVASLILGNEQPLILMMGLQSAGKTTILYRLQHRVVCNDLPDGTSIETVRYRDLGFVLWDISGQITFRELLPLESFKNTKAFIFVVDSNDREKVDEAAEELKGFLSVNKLKDAVLLVFANKQDLPNVMPVSELTDKLKLNQLENRRWHIQAISAMLETGLNEGMDWLYNELANK